MLCAGDRVATAGLARPWQCTQAVRRGQLLLALPGEDRGKRSCRVRSFLGVPPRVRAGTDQLPANKAPHVHAWASTAQSASGHVCTRVPGRECPAAPAQLCPGGGLRPLSSWGQRAPRTEPGGREPEPEALPLRPGPRQRWIREVRPQVSLGDCSPFAARGLWHVGSGSPSNEPWEEVSGVLMGGEAIPLAPGWAPAPETAPGPRSQTLLGTVLGSSGDQSKEEPGVGPFQDSGLMGLRAMVLTLPFWAPGLLQVQPRLRTGQECRTWEGAAVRAAAVVDTCRAW